LVLVAALAALPCAAAAQVRVAIPVAVARDAAAIHNAPATVRVRGDTTVPAGALVAGSLVVVGGDLALAGRVQGAVVVLDGNLRFARGAAVEGDVLVLGGAVDGRDGADVTGVVQVYAESLAYQVVDGRVELAGRAAVPAERWTLVGARAGTRFEALSLATARTYSRVEGLPLLIGPRLRVRGPSGTLSVDARAVVRLVEPIRWDRGTLGHDVEVAWRSPHARRAVSVAVRAFDVVDPVESWTVSDAEAGLAAAVARRDLRDHYGRHGGAGEVAFEPNRAARVAVRIGEERWAGRDARDAWSLFRRDEPWRANPASDVGDVRLGALSFRYDTRNARRDARSGWWIDAAVEVGDAEITAFGARSATAPPPAPGSLRWQAGHADVRRYNRLAPHASVDFRLFATGWLGGDQLPLQRRVSVTGPGALDGTAFRDPPGPAADDRSTCGGVALPGRPALCERAVLASVQYRGDLTLRGRGPRPEWWDDLRLDRVSFVLFADAGRGWTVEDPDGQVRGGGMVLRDLHTQVGAGLAMGEAGIYVAKSTSVGAEPPRLVVRLRRRF
jgi:hypothetical protein